MQGSFGLFALLILCILCDMTKFVSWSQKMDNHTEQSHFFLWEMNNLMSRLFHFLKSNTHPQWASMLSNLHVAGKIAPVQGQRGCDAGKHPDKNSQSVSQPASGGGLTGDRFSSIDRSRPSPRDDVINSFTGMSPSFGTSVGGQVLWMKPTVSELLLGGGGGMEPAFRSAVALRSHE